jgi:hypothetical protein
MSPIHSFQDLTIDLSRLGALELHGEPIKDKSCSISLAFTDSPRNDMHQIRFSSFGEAQRMYDKIANRWLDFEQKKSTARLVREAEKELYY